MVDTTAGIAEQPLQTAVGIAEQPLHGPLLRQINLNQGPNLGPRSKERRTYEHASEQFERFQAGRAGINWQGRDRDRADETRDRADETRDRADETWTSASRTLSRSTISSRLGPRTNVRERLGPRSNVHARLGPQGSIQSRLGSQGARVREQLHDECNDRRSPARSRTNTRRQATEESSQAQTPNQPHGQSNQGDRPLAAEEEVNQRRSRHQRRSTEEALRKEIDLVDCSPFTEEVERAPPPKRFTTPSITPFKGDSDLESHLRHFKSAMILYK
ncbi:pre-mRNA-splicing factor 38B-like, partial [Prunus avium]|uniref:Pre-mRNA-splicing factor 38B-like n=1 Tax=Prunus avium TaxID=42229 RepID=A0A6P5RGU9_PRUAV